MDMRLFLSTFALIFLAELGDKTQLAAMAATATGDNNKWTVFFAASAALVFSTLIAVLFGQTLTRFVPQHVIKLAAAILFIAFGLVILREAFGERAEVKAGAAEQGGVMAKVVLRLAAEFEKAAASDYRALAAGESDPDLAALFLSLARDEEEHLQTVSGARARHGEQQVGAAAETHEAERLSHDVSEKARPVLEHALEHERATADFYRELARDTVIPELKSIFSGLADQEDQHVAKLCAQISCRATPKHETG